MTTKILSEYKRRIWARLERTVSKKIWIWVQFFHLCRCYGFSLRWHNVVACNVLRNMIKGMDRKTTNKLINFVSSYHFIMLLQLIGDNGDRHWLTWIELSIKNKLAWLLSITVPNNGRSSIILIMDQDTTQDGTLSNTICWPNR
jgi:hypothetical protein